MAAGISTVISGTSLPVESIGQEQLAQHPTVKASANVVVIEDKAVPNEFYGPMFVGENMVPLKVSYDTLTEWTVINSDELTNLYASNTSS